VWHICPTYKESFQVRWDNSIPLFLHAAIYLEVSLFRWTSQNAFSRETAVYKWYCVQCCYAMQHCTQYHLYTAVSRDGRWQHGEKVGYRYPSGLEKTLCKSDIHVPLVTKGLRNLLTLCIHVPSALRLQPFLKCLYIRIKQQNIHCIHRTNATLSK